MFSILCRNRLPVNGVEMKHFFCLFSLSRKRYWNLFFTRCNMIISIRCLTNFKREQFVKRSYYLFFVMVLFTAGRLSAQVNASFTPSVQFGCPPLVVNFTDQSTGGPTTWRWEFDNGNVSNQKNPVESFSNPGVYNVLEIVSNGTSIDSQVMQIRVYQPPTDSFTSIGNIGCANPCHNVSFINLTIPGSSPVTQYAWDFGDGSLAVQGVNVTHCYSQTGTFSVILVARDSNGCQTNKTLPNYVVIARPPSATVSASPNQTCNSSLLVNFTGNGTSTNGPVTYAWYFGNGNTSAQKNPTQTYYSGVFNPILIVTDSLGCQDTARTQVAVTNVQAAFTSATTQACAGIPVQFTDSSNFALTWSWHFGDGGTSTLQNPTHVYNATGNYTVSLAVSYGPCKDSVSHVNYINVTQPVNFTVNANNTSACRAPFTVNFSNTAVGATAYTWNFGDSTVTSNLSNPSHTYTASGSYTVSLGVANAAGCVNTQTLTNFINIGGPNASFSVDSFHGCAPLTDGFTNTSTSSTPIVSYQWVFGDGGGSTSQNPTYTYNATGSYLPYLVVTNAAGCKDTAYAIDSVIVGNTLNPNFIALPLVQCVDQPVSFTNQTLGGGANTHYLWNFGDGQTSNLINPIHAYTDTGKYDITLTVTNQGCSKDTIRLKYIMIVVPKADFKFTFSCNSPTSVTFRDTSEGADTWYWDFGDGTTSTLKDPPVHNYALQGSYVVKLIVTNTVTGCVDSTKKTLPIGTPHVAFGSDVTSGCKSLVVHFSDSSVFASGWLWKFGDGGTSSLKNPVHSYADTGRYTVTLIINPGATCADTVVVTNYITVYGIIGDPIASPPVGCSPLSVAFTDSSRSYLGTIVSWKWHFGVNNDSSSIQNPVYVYNAAGNFIANLKVTDSHGCTGSYNKSISTKNVLAFFTSDTIVCPGELAHFTNLSQNGGSYRWEFGDNTTSNDTNATHSYASSGDYIVSLIAVNATYGCRDTFSSPYVVHVDTPIISFAPSSTFAQCPPFPVQFTNTSNRMDLKWLWQFGDGDTSTVANPYHIYKFPGYYSVTLIGTDSSGCVGRRTYVNLIQVKGPIGQFQATPTVGCVPLTVQFSGTTQSTESSIFVTGSGSSYSDQVAVQYTYTVPGRYYPVYTLTDSFGCQVAYPTATITVGSYPYPNLPPDTTVCRGNYVQLNLPAGDSIQTSETFTWTSNLSQTYLTCDTCQSPVCQSPDTIIYYIKSSSFYSSATASATCTARDTFVVNVDALPQIFPGLDFRVCPNDTIQMHAGPNVTAATWSPNLFISDSSIANPKVWPLDTITYRVTGVNDAGCSISRIVRVYPITKVVADIAVRDTSVCAGSQVPIDVVVTQASIKDTTFQWYPSTYLNSPTSQFATATLPAGNYTYTVIVRSSTCIADTGSMHITVSSPPDLEAGDKQTVAVGTTVQLYAASHQNVTYTWTPAYDSLSCTICRKPYITVNKTETVHVVAENQYGCKTEDSVQLSVLECDNKAVFVPNTFTPNNDGLNDRLFVRGGGLRGIEYFRVFDRWGDLVFETHDISDGWDGSVKGKPGDIATYVYVLKGVCSSGSTVDMSGNVTLVR